MWTKPCTLPRNAAPWPRGPLVNNRVLCWIQICRRIARAHSDFFSRTDWRLNVDPSKQTKKRTMTNSGSVSQRSIKCLLLIRKIKSTYTHIVVCTIDTGYVKPLARGNIFTCGIISCTPPRPAMNTTANWLSGQLNITPSWCASDTGFHPPSGRRIIHRMFSPMQLT